VQSLIIEKETEERAEEKETDEASKLNNLIYISS